MSWILVIIVVVVLLLVRDLYIAIKDHIDLRKRYPEYMRDKDKELKVGQVWIHPAGERTYMITAISKNRVRYHMYALPLKGSQDRSLAFSSTVTEDAFRKAIHQSKLHLREQTAGKIQIVSSQDITKPHINISAAAKEGGFGSVDPLKTNL